MNKKIAGNREVVHSEPGSSSGQAFIPPENLIPLQLGAKPRYAGDHAYDHSATTKAGFIESGLGRLDRLTPEELVMAGASAMSAMVAANTDTSHRPTVINPLEVPPGDFLG